MIEFDILAPADNGLRRGRTTGTCAAAAVKAAAWLLLYGEILDKVAITLPDGEHFISVPVLAVTRLDDGGARAEVIKEAGDDPDQTDGATIFATVAINHLHSVRFLAASGVGTVTEHGIRVPVGEPAINPVPRQMMILALDEVLDGSASPGFDLSIGCVNGQEIAKKTFNPRLGIKGGISILGTSGIVEPMSLSAYKASIEVYIRVALGDRPREIAFMPGNIGTGFAQKKLSLSKKQIVHTSNFVGFSLSCLNTILVEERFRLATLWFLGHPGKIAKVLDGSWDTHSARSKMAMPAIAEVACELNFQPELVQSIRESNTVEAIMDLLGTGNQARELWLEIENRAGRIMQNCVPEADSVAVRLFSMNGTPLGAAA